MSNTIVITLSFIYANATDRQNAVGLVFDDIGKFAKQSDDFTYWQLTNDSPVTWGALSSSTVDATDVLLSDIIVNEETKLSETVVRIQNIPISPEVPTDGYSLVYDGYTNEWQPRRINSGTNLLANFIFNGAGAVLIPGNYGFLKFAAATTIPQFDLYADPSGDLVIDIAQTTAAAFPAGFSTVVTITLVAAQKITEIPGTPISIAADDILRFTITGIPTYITVATLNMVLM